jgi:glutathione S-transferase
MMKLFFSPGAGSLAQHILLAECDANFKSQRVDLKTKKTSTGEDFFKINPKGQVPTLLTNDGKILTEGAVIVQFIADQFPERELLPRMGTWERYRANEWLNYIASEIHKSFGVMFSADRMIASMDGNAQLKAGMRQHLVLKLNYLSSHLALNSYLLGESFSAADAYLFTCLGWHKYVDLNLNQWPEIVSYMQKISARPAVQRALELETL